MYIQKKSRSSTKYRILLSSHILFSKYGFQNTTLRQITALSNTNLASVNYHFGSKDGLIENIIKLILNDFFEIYNDKYKNLIQNKQNNIEKIIEIIIQSLIEINKSNPNACILLYRFHEIYTYNNNKYIKIIDNFSAYSDNLARLRDDLNIALNFLNQDDINIRFSFLLNSFISLLLIIDASDIKNNIMYKPNHSDHVLKLIPIITAGVLHQNINE